MPRHSHRTTQVLFVGSVTLVVAAPVAIGSVHPETQVVLAAVAVLLASVGIVYWRWRGMSLPAGAPFWIVAGLAVVIVVQLLPLPHGLKRVLDPEGQRLLGPVISDLKRSVWPSLAWDAPGGVLALLHHISCAAVLLVTCGVCRNRGRAHLMAWTLDVALLAVAFFSAVHLFSGASRIWWLYKPLWWQGFMAPFVSQNHAAALFLVSACLHVGLCFTVTENRKRWALLPVAALPCFLVLQSNSRSAFVGLLAGFALFFVLMRVNGTIQRKAFWQALLLAGVSLIALLPSVGMIRKTFGRKDTTVLSANQKVQAWRDSLTMIRRHPVVGVGRGSFQVGFTQYKRFPLRVTVTHAENLPIQIASEMGLFVCGFLFLAAGWFVTKYFRKAKLRTLDCAAISAVSGLFIQNLADFNLEFPGTAFVAMALLGLLAGRHMDRRSGKRERDSSKRARLGPYVAAGVFVLGGAITTVVAAVWAVPYHLRADAGRVEKALAENRWGKARTLALSGLARHPADYYLHLLAGYAEARARKGTPLKWLNHALRLNRSDPRPHLVSASVLLELGMGHQAALQFNRAFERGAPLTPKRLTALVGLAARLRGQSAPELRACTLAWQMAGFSGVGAFPGVPYLVQSGAAQLEINHAGGSAALALPAKASDLYLLVRALKAEGKDMDAEAVLEWVADRWPQEHRAFLELVKSNLGRGRNHKAYEWARRLLVTSTSDDAFFVAARAAEAAESGTVAYQLLVRGLTLNPYSAVLAIAAARMALRRGELAEARKIVRRRLQLGGLALLDRAKLHDILVEVAERGRGKGGDAVRRKVQERMLLGRPGLKMDR